MKSISPVLYSQLNDQERLKLVLEALARKDSDEAARLGESVPHSAYQILMTSYHRTASALLHIAHSFELAILPNLVELELFLGFDAILERASKAAHRAILGALAIGKAGSVKAVPEGEAYPPVPAAVEESGAATDLWGLSEALTNGVYRAAAKSKAAVTAFEQFCHETTELRPELVIQALCPLTHKKLAELREYLEATHNDPELTQRHLLQFHDLWRFRQAQA